MKPLRLFAAGLLLNGVAFSQGVPRPPTPIPSRPLPGPGAQAPLPLDPCLNAVNLFRTLTLEPSTIYPGDQVTLRWDARDPRGFAWDGSVRFRSSFPISPALPDPATKSGSHTFRAPETPVFGTITMETVQGLCRKTKTVQYERVHTPSITSVTPARGPSGTDVRIQGSDFGPRQESQVRLAVGGQTLNPTPSQWGNTSIHFAVPNGMPLGNGIVRVVRGGRLESNGVAFRVTGIVTIDTALALAATANMGLGQTGVNLHHGANASHVLLGAGLAGGAAADFPFTLPEFEVDVPQGEKIAQTILLPGTGFPERVQYRVNRFNSSGGIGVSVANGQLVLSMGFESAGSEIQGRLRYCDAGAFGKCLSHSWRDNLVPDIQIDGARVTLRLTPGVSGGALAFPSAADSFDANVRIGSEFANWIAPRLNQFAEQLKTGIGNAVHNGLNPPAIRRALAGAFMSVLRDRGVDRVLSVSTSGGNIVIEFD